MGIKRMDLLLDNALIFDGRTPSLFSGWVGVAQGTIAAVEHRTTPPPTKTDDWICSSPSSCPDSSTPTSIWAWMPLSIP